MTFLHPWMGLLALVVPLGFWFRRRRGEPALLFAPGALPADGTGGGPPRSWRVRLLPLPAVLEAAALLLLVAALARPVERSPLPLRSEGADILLGLDVSSSMTARDLDGRRTRLEVAKEAALRFVRGRPGDRIGLLAFARYPDVRCPPTLDHGALAALLRAVGPVEGDGPEDATGIGAAAARAAAALRGGAKSRVVILLTDGEENVAPTGAPGSIDPLHAAALCAELGVRVHAVAAGGSAPGGRSLGELAARTGGRFFEARDAGAVEGVYAAIDALETSSLDRPEWAVEERFGPFVAGALALLLLALLLRATVLAVLP